ncbi:MAG: Uma2 family endonuclease [Cyanobacteria bacterium P01_D01_bin.1]
MTLTLAKWTLDEYHRLIKSEILVEKRVELLHGEIVEMPPEGESHAYFSDEFGETLTQLLGARAKVRHAKPITLPNQSEPEPDIAVVQRLGREYLSHHPYPENVFWLIEYSDTSLQKDLEVKTKVYAEVDIPEYWVVDLKKRTLIVFRKPRMGQYTSRQEYTSGKIVPLAFPDISVEVSTIVD